MIKTIAFSKMHGIGNDFVIINNQNGQLQLTKQQRQCIADRHFGIGCDQLILLETSNKIGCDFFYRIYNADGSAAEQCGNGARCLALFIHQQQLSTKTTIKVETTTGTTDLRIIDNQQVTVILEPPQLSASAIPILADGEQYHYRLTTDLGELTFTAVNTGNPHAVICVDDVNTAPIASIGALLSRHKIFPEQCNIGFMQILSRDAIALRVFERGSGETLACGSGACAAVVVGRLAEQLATTVRVHLPGGELRVHWPHHTAAIELTGPATHVFTGQIDLAC